MVLTIIESPYAGEVNKNIKYAKACVRDSLTRGEFPICSHLLFTQKGILDDDNPEERDLGIQAGHAWMDAADIVAFYVDRGFSSGMLLALEKAAKNSYPVIEIRRLEQW